jgi:hypothetical protein
LQKLLENPFAYPAFSFDGVEQGWYNAPVMALLLRAIVTIRQREIRPKIWRDKSAFYHIRVRIGHVKIVVPIKFPVKISGRVHLLL